ncbi:MAG: NIPSNAP family protein [Steroidobacteraceae bacterium]
MIVEQRTYTIQIGKMNAFRDAFAEKGLPAQKRILGNFLGFFVSDVGELNQAIQMWGYESYAERERRRAILATDPDWLDYLRNSPPVILRQENRILLPAAFSPIS